MKRIKLKVAYDGTNYCGWQIQKNGVTVEGVLNRCLTRLLGEPIAVIGASRTDSGVHAMENIAVFDTKTRIPPEKICFALNRFLPEDIQIQESKEVAPDYHPRKRPMRKTYEYRIQNRTFLNPIQRLYTYFVYRPIDVEAMKQGASYLTGEHDFKSFCSARAQVVSTVRTIYFIRIEQQRDLISIKVCGNGFLYNMVRIIVGTLLKVGFGVYPPEQVKTILDAGDRKLAGPVAPACGLTLLCIEEI